MLDNRLTGATVTALQHPAQLFLDTLGSYYLDWKSRALHEAGGSSSVHSPPRIGQDEGGVSLHE